MSFILDFTALFTVFAVAIALTVGLLAVTGGTFLARNRKVRVARHESVPAYYGHLVLGH